MTVVGTVARVPIGGIERLVCHPRLPPATATGELVVATAGGELVLLSVRTGPASADLAAINSSLASAGPNSSPGSPAR
ncbi:hypothetical protein [Nocardia sp. X0981]